MRNTIKNKKQAWWKVGCTAVAATGAAITLISIAVHLHLGNETKINKVDADKVQDVDVEGDNNKVGDTYNTYIENNYYQKNVHEETFLNADCYSTTKSL